MTVLDDQVTVMRLACLTEARTDSEQKAMLRVARKLDREWNEITTLNKATWEYVANAGDGMPAYVLRRDLLGLEAEVDRSRVLEDGDKAVSLPAKGRWMLDTSVRTLDGRG